MTHPNLVASMLNPDFYPHRPKNVQLVQTHISYVFIAGDLVYKVKKPVNYGFLDFTSLDQRRYFCNQELTLNRRLAPEAYLAVEPICEDATGQLRLGEDGGRVVEYAVKMVRLPEGRMLKVLLAERKVGLEKMAAIAEKIAAFHAAAATGGPIDEMGKIDTVRFNCEENFEQTMKYVGSVIAPEKYDFIRDYVSTFIDDERALFEKRVADHRIRDCHGDLHMEHICLSDGIIIFDCIEFNERFRFSDTASEVAFLAMDLDYNGYVDHAEAFVSAYCRASGDRELLKLLNFYRCYRAYVRAKVTSFRLDDETLSELERETIMASAFRYYDLAFRYAARLSRPALILNVGLMGSGKSVLARALSPLLDADVIRMDVLRKQMLDIAPSERHYEDFGAGIYSEEVSDQAYALAFKRAEEKLKAGRTVMIDASFKKRHQRGKARELAQRLHVDFFVLECVCPESEIKSRLERRAHKASEASDGRWEIFQAQKADYEAIDSASSTAEMPAASHVTVDTSDSKDVTLVRALRGMKKIIDKCDR